LVGRTEAFPNRHEFDELSNGDLSATAPRRSFVQLQPLKIVKKNNMKNGFGGRISRPFRKT